MPHIPKHVTNSPRAMAPMTSHAPETAPAPLAIAPARPSRPPGAGKTMVPCISMLRWDMDPQEILAHLMGHQKSETPSANESTGVVPIWQQRG
jgi:hypothetical protein